MLVAALLAFPALAAAQDAPRPHPWEVRADAGRENLDRGLPDWTEERVQLTFRPTVRQAAFAGFRETERFDQRDREGFGGVYVPVFGGVAHVEGTWSSTHRVLPRDSYLAEWIQPAAGGWLFAVGARRTRYTPAISHLVWGSVEKYAGDFRYAYRLQGARVEGGPWSASHRVSASWYRGELTYATLAGSAGREIDSVFVDRVVAADVRAVTLEGGLEVTPSWGLLLELGWTRQGDFYTRRAGRVGARLIF
jgi:YaiO family outer membrane protein